MNVFDALKKFLDLHALRGYPLPPLVAVNSRVYYELASDAVALSYYHSNPIPHFMVRGVSIEENIGQATEFVSATIVWNAPSTYNIPTPAASGRFQSQTPNQAAVPLSAPKSQTPAVDSVIAACEEYTRNHASFSHVDANTSFYDELCNELQVSNVVTPISIGAYKVYMKPLATNDYTLCSGLFGSGPIISYKYSYANKVTKGVIQSAQPYTPSPTPSYCECGSDKVGSPIHSNWCPKS